MARCASSAAFVWQLSQLTRSAVRDYRGFRGLSRSGPPGRCGAVPNAQTRRCSRGSSLIRTAFFGEAGICSRL